MTREEAIKILENGGWWDLLIPITTIEGRSDEDKLHQAIDMAISALRSVSREQELETENKELKERIVNWRKYMAPTREQVEKVFPGCRSCKSCRSCVFCINNLKDMPCKKCDPNAECVVTEYKPSNFCPVCGKPLTDEAVQMVMEKMEALHGET